MKIAVNPNRFTDANWHGIIWTDADKLDSAGVDWIVYCGPNLELLQHPSTFLPYIQRFFSMVAIAADSIHTSRPDFPAALGMPEFRNDFFVLRCSGSPAVERYAADFLARWQEGMDISTIAHELGQEPAITLRGMIRSHVGLDEMPTIKWGSDD